jgi:hypothetical protein
MPRNASLTYAYLASLMSGHAKANRHLNDELLSRVMAGDQAAREKMVLANLPMVATKVNMFLDNRPEWGYLFDDLMSEGIIGLVQAVNKMANPDADDGVAGANPTGLISIYIYHRLGELIDKEVTMRIPARTRRRKSAAGKELLVPTKESSLTSRYTFEIEGLTDPRSMIEMMDELYGCCETAIERRLIELRIEGRKDDEIAMTLGLPKTTAYMMRRSIYARFLERNPDIRGEV